MPILTVFLSACASAWSLVASPTIASPARSRATCRSVLIGSSSESRGRDLLAGIRAPARQVEDAGDQPGAVRVLAAELRPEAGVVAAAAELHGVAGPEGEDEGPSGLRRPVRPGAVERQAAVDRHAAGRDHDVIDAL